MYYSFVFVLHSSGSLVFWRLTDFHVSCFLQEESVERAIGLILRESGDRLNEQVRNTDIKLITTNKMSFNLLDCSSGVATNLDAVCLCNHFIQHQIVSYGI